MLTVQKPKDKEESAVRPTTTFHEEQNGKPAITLTTYMVEVPEQPATNFLPTSWKPDHSARADNALVNGSQMGPKQLYQDEHFTDDSEDIELAVDHIDLRHTTAKLEKLSKELDEHFERLKSEYEYKRGTKWTPLRPWNRESWIWEHEHEHEHEQRDVGDLAENLSFVDESTHFS